MDGADICVRSVLKPNWILLCIFFQILLTFEYFYLYLPEKQLLIFSIMALKLTLHMLVRNIVYICVVFSKSKFFLAICLTDFKNYIFWLAERFTD